MLILEEPYVSKLLLETAEDNQFSVLKNEMVQKKCSDYKLNLLEDNIAKNVLKMDKNTLLYSNSENSINWIFNNFGNSDLYGYISVFKDKNKFRKVLSKIYPDFFFRKYSIKDLDEIDIDIIPKPFIIKPNVGFLSLGVYSVKDKNDWLNVLNSIKADSDKFSDGFSEDIVNSSSFIIEQFIEGEEYAIDAYFSREGKAVILNILNHPFITKEDVSDRVYLTSKKIILDNLKPFQTLLDKIGELFNIKSFPLHMEVRVTKDGKIIPIEINPMRFAGWCTTDIAYFAYDVNVYEYYFNQMEPDWESILEEKDGQLYYFAMAEVPSEIDRNKIAKFDYKNFMDNFSNILETRKIDYQNYPLFAIIFGQTGIYDEISKILKIKTADYIKRKEDFISK